MDDIQSWWEVPSIAHFCSLFRAAFNLLDFDIEELEIALLTDGAEDAGSSLLQELIVRLLCGCVSNGQEISVFNYQMFLRRLFRKKCKEYGRPNPFNTDIDFQFLPLRTKVEILHALCDFRLDGEDVQDLLKNLESDSLRVEALGQDENCSAYWYFYGTRLYKEDFPRVKKKSKEKKRGSRKKVVVEEDSDEFEGESKWTVVCYTEQDWENLTTKLQDSTDLSEKALYHTLSVDFLPEIPRLFAEKERLQMKRMMEYQPRRASRRLTKLNKQKEEAQHQTKPRGRGSKNVDDEEEEDGIEDVEEEEREIEEKEVEEEIEETPPPPPKERRGRKPKVKSEDEDDVELETRRGRKPRSPVQKEKKPGRKSKEVEEELDEETQSSVGKEHVSKRGRHHKGHKNKSKKRVEESADEVSDAESFDSSKKVVSRRGRGRGAGAGGTSRSSPAGRGRGHRASPAPPTPVVAPTGRQTNNSLACATGPIFIQPPVATTAAPAVATKKATQKKKLRSSQVFAQSDEDLQTGMYKILEHLKTHPDAWPFSDPVEEEYAPRYYAIVSEPMDLQRMEDKLDSGMYLTFSEFKSDFKLIVTNCKKYNGHENEYTEMVENLETAFERAATRYLESDFSTDEEVAIEFPVQRVADSPPPPSNHSSLSRSLTPEHQDRVGRSRSGMGRRGKRKAEAEEERRGRKKRAETEKEDTGRKHHKDDGEKKRKHHGEDKKHSKEERRSHREERKREEVKEERRGRRRKIEREDEVESVKSHSSDEPLKRPDTPRSPTPKPAPPPVGPYGRRRAGPPPKPPAPRKPPERRRRSSDDEDEDDLSDCDRENKEGSRKREAPRSAGNVRKRKKTGGIKNNAAIEALELATEQTLKDINKWLDDTPRFSEFSSASNSPSHYLGADEYTNTSAIDREYRRSLKMSGDALDKKDGDESRRFRQEKRKPKPSHTSSLEALRDKRKKEVQRTIERLQPGKSKGNLISNLPKTKTEEGGDVMNNVVKSNKEKNNSLVSKSDEATPKLSLGSVLNTSIGFGKHTFTEKPVVEKEIKELVEDPPSPEEVEEKPENEKEEKEGKEEEEKEKKVPPPSKPTAKVIPDSNKATPNLSAWFKAFGAPKAAPPKKKVEAIVEPRVEAVKPVAAIEPTVQEPIKSPSKSPEVFQNQAANEKPSRHRNLSTGSSSVSDMSAFSQDIGEMSEVASPRDRMMYHQSPPALSPSSPRPPPPPPTSHFPINGTIKVGFYQDTSSQKSSPDKGSPREEQVATPTNVPTPQTTPTYPQYTPPRSYPTISNPTYEAPPSNVQFNPNPIPPVSKPAPQTYNQSDLQYYDTSKPLTDQYREVVSHRTQPSPPKTIQSQAPVHPEYTRAQQASVNPPTIPNIPTTIHHHSEYPKLQPPTQPMQPANIPSYPQAPIPPPSYLTSTAPIKPNPMIIPQPPMRNLPNNLIIPQTGPPQNPQPDPKLLQQYPVKKRMVYNTEIMEEPRYPPMDMASYHQAAQNQQRLVHPSLGLPPYYDPSTGSMLQPPYDLTTPVIKETPQPAAVVPPVKQKRRSKKAAAQEATKLPDNIAPPNPTGTAFQQYVALSKDPISLKSSVPGSAFNFGSPGLSIPTGHPLYNPTDKNNAYFADYRNFYDNNKLKSTQVSSGNIINASQASNQSPQQAQQQQQTTTQCIGGPTSPQSPYSFLGQPPAASRAPQSHHHQIPYQQSTLPPTTSADSTPTYHQYQQMDQKSSMYYHHQFAPQSHPSLASTFAPPYSPSPPQQVATSTQNPSTTTRAPPHHFMMENSQLYQQYYRHQGELLLQATTPQRHANPLLPVHQGLLGPPAGYPPGPYHPSLGIRQPFDGINRPSWL